MKNPPILISVIGFFAMLAGLAWIFLGLRILGFDWFTLLGDVGDMEQSGLWGWLAIGAGSCGSPPRAVSGRCNHGRGRSR